MSASINNMVSTRESAFSGIASSQIAVFRIKIKNVAITANEILSRYEEFNYTRVGAVEIEKRVLKVVYSDDNIDVTSTTVNKVVRVNGNIIQQVTSQVNELKISYTV